MNYEAGDMVTYKGEAALVLCWHPEHPVLVIELCDNTIITVTLSELDME